MNRTVEYLRIKVRKATLKKQGRSRKETYETLLRTQDNGQERATTADQLGTKYRKHDTRLPGTMRNERIESEEKSKETRSQEVFRLRKLNEHRTHSRIHRAWE
jgi:NH3-dependent NAD+ synthetase